MPEIGPEEKGRREVTRRSWRAKERATLLCEFLHAGHTTRTTELCAPLRREVWRRVLGIMAFLAAGGVALAQEGQPSTPSGSVWQEGVAEGFVRGTQELDLSAGPGVGMKIFGSRHAHDWVIASADYGRMLTGVIGKDRWYRGNLEVLGEVFGGEQYQPDDAYLVGGALHLRYNFALGHRWVPFVDVGAGGTGTNIRDGDLSTKFEFNLQAVTGTHVFLRDDLALTLQYRFMHLSNAGLDAPNLGVNTSNLL